jgi:hypothetical protein
MRAAQLLLGCVLTEVATSLRVVRHRAETWDEKGKTSGVRNRS